jgi:hypothetical protein
MWAEDAKELVRYSWFMAFQVSSGRSLGPRGVPSPLVGTLLVGLLLTVDATADSAAYVEITMLGPSAVQIRVADGTTFPCDSTNNRMLVQGKFNPGNVVLAVTSNSCLCVQQTFEPFPDTDWSAPALACRPLVCSGTGRARRCVPAPDPTIRVRIHSKQSD